MSDYAEWGDKDTQLKGEEYIEQNYGNVLCSYEEKDFLFIIGDLLDDIARIEKKTNAKSDLIMDILTNGLKDKKL